MVGGISVGQTAVRNVPKRDHQPLIVVGESDDVPAVDVDAVDGGMGAVEQPEPVVVTQHEDGVAFSEGASRQHDPVGTEPAPCPQDGAGSTVEVIHVGEPTSNHESFFASSTGAHPLLDQELSRLVVGRRLVDALVLQVGVDR
jgi:hypothetical protein